MDKVEFKSQSIKITFLEINPPINELIKGKEEMNIIFQGHDNFYDFKKHLFSKTPIQINCLKNSLIITLLKSNNILATGLFTIRPGEQNVILNYENKRKIVSTKSVNINNLLEFIKIKIFCEFDNLNTNKDKENSSSAINNIINDPSGKYVPKVNLMKANHLNKNKNNNNITKKPYDKKKKFLGNFYVNNSIKKNINISQEVCFGGEYSTYLTEEMNNLRQSNNNTNSNTNEIKKLNPYYSSKINKNNNLSHKKDIDNSAINKGKHVNKAKSKNYFNTIKRQYKTGHSSQIKMNNSSLNLISQNNKIISVETSEMNTINNNIPFTNRNALKPTISFNKNSKRNINTNNKINLNNNKNLINNLDNLISGQIIEHVDMSKKGTSNNITSINNNSEKKKLLSMSNNFNKNESKKRKLNNVTMNSISTAGTKKNVLEFSINSLQDYEDKSNSNKNSFMPFSNRVNERLKQKLSGNNLNYKKVNKHKFNKSLCQNSFTEKLFSENGFNLNLNEQNTNSTLCKSYNKLPKNSLKNKNFSVKLENNDNIINYNDNNINSIYNTDFQKNEDINGFEDENIDVELEYYLKIKEDFNLLYNEEYIKQINEDLLKLEIELFIEKMSELFSSYHIQMEEKILENQIIKRDYKKNIANYLLYMKLNNKMQFVKSQQQIKKLNLKDKGINLDRQNYENVNINMNELNIFKFIFHEKNKNEKLKKIVSIILKKHGNKELLDEKDKGL